MTRGHPGALVICLFALVDGCGGSEGAIADGAAADGQSTDAPGGDQMGGAAGGGSGDGSGGGGSGGGGAGGGSATDGPPMLPDAGPPLTPGDPGKVDVTFDVRSDKDVRAISPLIYGTNGDPGIATNRQTLVRSGGNRLTAYNWENNASNAGSDWCFQNDAQMSASSTPGEAIRPMVMSAKANGATALVTVPIVDYVAADKMGGSGPPDCSGDVRKSGASYLDTRFKKNRPAKAGAFSAMPDAGDAFVYQDEFASWLAGAVPGAKVMFDLDNEPDLWSETHAEIHPAKLTYAELVKRDVDFATALKTVAPTAEIAGFVSYGWNGYVTLQDAPDAGGKDFVEYYLDHVKSAGDAAGKRLVDYLDLHWYPEAQGGGTRITGTGTGAAVVAAREQAPRSLWDDTYKEDSWITMWSTMGPIRLVPRMLAKIAAHYPGTKLGFSEWNYGAGGHISGAIATADVLGIFGREGVGMATIWFLGSDETFTLAGLRAFRNYDGAGAHFGDVSISASTTDVVASSVYASLDAAAPGRVVIVAINKNTTPLVAGIRVAHPTLFKTAAVWTLTAAGGAALESAMGLTTVATNAFRATLPAQSVSVIIPAP